jgi:hypothetical protein
MADVENLIRQRIQEELDRRNQIRRGAFDELGAIKGILGGGQQQPAAVNNVYGGMQSPMAAPPPSMGGMAQQEIKPEDYEYLVDIEKRDVYGEPEIDPETGMPMKQKPLGWDKSVKRYAKPRPKPDATNYRDPTMGDLSGDGMKEFDRRRDKRGRFTSEMTQGTLFDEE